MPLASTVIADDLARVVDADCNGAAGGQGIVEAWCRCRRCRGSRGVPLAFDVLPDDLARVVDANCLGAVEAEGIVEGGVRIDWHDTGSSVIVSLAKG